MSYMSSYVCLTSLSNYHQKNSALFKNQNAHSFNQPISFTLFIRNVMHFAFTVTNCRALKSLWLINWRVLFGWYTTVWTPGSAYVWMKLWK